MASWTWATMRCACCALRSLCHSGQRNWTAASLPSRPTAAQGSNSRVRCSSRPKRASVGSWPSSSWEGSTTASGTPGPGARSPCSARDASWGSLPQAAMPSPWPRTSARALSTGSTHAASSCSSCPRDSSPRDASRWNWLAAGFPWRRRWWPPS
uniref:Uncharacterized protein n=1 Tax=Ixodes ricinus TaxID=34613 RepID=A0A6B0UVK2_IXORI